MTLATWKQQISTTWGTAKFQNISNYNEVKVDREMPPATDADVLKHLGEAMKIMQIENDEDITMKNVGQLTNKLRQLIEQHKQRRLTWMCLKCKKAGVKMSDCHTCSGGGTYH